MAANKLRDRHLARPASSMAASSSTLCMWKAAVALLVAVIAVLCAKMLEQQQALAATQHRLDTFVNLEPREPNFQWQEEWQQRKEARTAHESSHTFVDELFSPSNHFPHGHNATGWEQHVRSSTPEVFESANDTPPPTWCTDLAHIVLTPDETPRDAPLSQAARERASRALRECGYVYLDNFFSVFLNF